MRLAVVSDEISAAGWRLIGARIHIPEAGTHERCFHDALSDADVVLITAREASKVPASQLNAALFSYKPLVLVIADITHALAPANLENEVIRALGVSL